MVDAAPTRGTGRHRRRNRHRRHVGAGDAHLGATRGCGGDSLSLVAGTEHHGDLGLDHPGARRRKHGLADCDHDSNADRRESAERRTDGNDPERSALRTLHLGVLDHLRVWTVQASARTTDPAGASPRKRTSLGTEQKSTGAALKLASRHGDRIDVDIKAEPSSS